MLAQSLGRRRVVLVVAEHEESPEPWFRLLQDLDEQGDVFNLFAHVAGDAQQVGAHVLERGCLCPEQTLVGAADVQVADMNDRHVWPVLAQREAVALEDRPVRLAEDGVTEARQEGQWKKRQTQAGQQTISSGRHERVL